jgi:hypothetical protein
MMHGDSLVVYFGVRYRFDPVEEAEYADVETQLQAGTYPIVAAAKNVGLQAWWGFTTSDDFLYLLVGAQLAKVSAERVGLGWKEWISCTDEEFRRIAEETQAKLYEAGISDHPMLHAHAA